ncbi:MAG: sugar phosphorylase, partial [Deltaproteobacteria bacterium]|nr:sugar phosphorylase [Deltaproteobacteria bacterium]
DPYHAERFLASQAIEFVFPGVPAVYIHSILGSHNWTKGVEQTQRARTINRQKLQLDDLLSELNDPESFRSRIFFPYIELIKTRREQRAFHPNAPFEILDVDSGVFAVKRFVKEQVIFALTNISSQTLTVSLSGSSSGDVSHIMKDLISGENFSTSSICLTPYQYVWLST